MVITQYIPAVQKILLFFLYVINYSKSNERAHSGRLCPVDEIIFLQIVHFFRRIPCYKVNLSQICPWRFGNMAVHFPRLLFLIKKNNRISLRQDWWLYRRPSVQRHKRSVNVNSYNMGAYEKWTEFYLGKLKFLRFASIFFVFRTFVYGEKNN